MSPKRSNRSSRRAKAPRKEDPAPSDAEAKPEGEAPRADDAGDEAGPDADEEAGASPPSMENPPGAEGCPIVAIGASAGGLEAINEFLASVGSEPGVGFVVVQHLAPSHESLLSEILSRAAKMPVRRAEQGMPVEPDHVYVIPPDRDMTISERRLRLAKRAEGMQRHLPIDLFFRSLAEDCGSKAIGVVFSGTSSDGTAGLQSIKTAGGITFAQDEKSARYPEMPRSAAASGAVDFVLPPAGMAAELLRLRAHAYVVEPPRDGDAVPDGDATALEQVLQILRAATSTDFTHYKQSTIRRRILRRMALGRVERLEDYVRLLRQNRGEVEALYDDVLINVTAFFRDPAAFKAIQKRILPAILRKRPETSKVRIWVPGCSTGEEVYSIAILVFEHLGERANTAQIQIFGTDVSDGVVDRARAGKYPPTISSDVSAERLRRFFVRTTDGFQVGKALRDVCVFAKHNVLKDPPFSKIDFVSCRNVLIYFGAPLQRKAVSLFHYALRPDGYLMLGVSENIATFTDLFSLVDKRHKIYAKRSIPNRLYFGPGVEDGPLAVPPVPTTGSV